ncbi:hypothetical protein MTP99_018441 [Tenebrio molitor]|nr:hypothetical protein MTP99_018441 [Tenebrio molitor]
METKVLFFHLLSNFEIVPVAKTQIPIRFDRKAINMSAEKGFWVGLQRLILVTSLCSESVKMMWILIIIIIVIAIALGCYKIVDSHKYWIRKGVVQGKPMFLLGDTWGILLRKYSAPELNLQLYNISPNARYCGIYQFLLPTLLIRDPDLIKQITVKDFDHFVDHRGFVPTESDPLLGKSLFSLSGMKWREMRSTLSPSFTSSKMKYLFSIISQNGEQFVKHFQEQDKDVVTVEMRDVITKFTNDVIANSVFGFDCNSLKEPNNEFYVRGKEATDFKSFRKIFVFMGSILIPQLIKLFKISFFSEKMITFFTKIVKENIYSREKLGVVRPDMINLLLQARKPNFKYEESQYLPDTGFATVEESDIGQDQKISKKDITDEDITAQAFIFFFAGFDSVSSLLCFMSHELAVNQDVQEKLIQEVDDTWNECDGKITYEALMSMKYMDMVVSETLRKWPNAIATDRICTKPYTIEPKSPNEKPLRLEVNDNVLISMYAIHRDPQYYPDPDRFDPERFSDENKSKIHPYTYLPFGTGPRSCIGSRFALMETKVLFFHLLSSFEIVPVEKTQIPIRFSRKAINMSAEKGKPMFLLGDTWGILIRKYSAPELNLQLYNIIPNARYCGIYQFLLPTLLIRDPDLIKQITVKDFDHFVDHRGFVPTESDPLLGKSLFSLSGMKWREMRSTLSPSFTSSKVKYLFSIISQNGEQFVKHFQEQDKGVVTVEMRDVITKFTNDVIANSVFGFDCNSLKEPNNEFYVRGKEATDFKSFRKIFVFMGSILIPQLIKLFKISFFSEKMITFFTKIVKENIYSREKHGVVRPDMINLLLQARKPNFKYEQSQSLPDTGFATVEESEIGQDQKLSKKDITDEDITAQAFIFFFAGFDSVSSLLCFMSHELAVNQDVQEKLMQEVDDTWNECDGKITYEALMSMKYMDMVVSETLRKWPNAIATDRVCTKPYTIEPKSPNEKPLRLEVNDNVLISMYAIHRDPQYYPDPDRFDPERFSDENKSKIHPYTYLPFGTGPRSCIGSRFALMETKVLFFHLLSSFEIVPVEKTQIPIRFSRKAINMSAEKGFWVGLQKRATKI